MTGAETDCRLCPQGTLWKNGVLEVSQIRLTRHLISGNHEEGLNNTLVLCVVIERILLVIASLKGVPVMASWAKPRSA